MGPDYDTRHNNHFRKGIDDAVIAIDNLNTGSTKDANLSNLWTRDVMSLKPAQSSCQATNFITKIRKLEIKHAENYKVIFKYVSVSFGTILHFSKDLVLIHIIYGMKETM